MDEGPSIRDSLDRGLSDWWKTVRGNLVWGLGLTVLTAFLLWWQSTPAGRRQVRFGDVAAAAAEAAVIVALLALLYHQIRAPLLVRLDRARNAEPVKAIGEGVPGWDLRVAAGRTGVDQHAVLYPSLSWFGDGWPDIAEEACYVEDPTGVVTTGVQPEIVDASSPAYPSGVIYPDEFPTAGPVVAGTYKVAWRAKIHGGIEPKVLASGAFLASPDDFDKFVYRLPQTLKR
jgi:hypothetical protein